MKKIATLLAFLYLGLLSVPVQSQNNYPLRFRWGTEYLPDNFRETAGNLPAYAPEELVNGYYVRYIQCLEIPNGDTRAVLERQGVQFLSYVQFGAYLTAIPAGFDLNKFSILKPRSIVPVNPDWKLANTLREEPYGEWAVRGDLVDINLQVYPFVSIDQGAEWCAQYGMTILLKGRQNGFIQARILKDNLHAIAALPFIQHMELIPPPGQPEDVNGRSIHRSGLLDVSAPGGLKLNGEGVSVLVRDDGPIGPHIDYQGRLINISDDTGSADGTHGDGVGGIIGGAGNVNPNNKGMADGTLVYAIDYVNNFQDTTLPLFLNQNVTITNSSYSDGCNTGYTLATVTVDQQIYEHPALMHVFSAGNSNGSNCNYGAGNQWGNITGGHKMAKNAIATANLNANIGLENSSSRGPAHDGRLKPDIAAHGAGQISTDHNNNYQVFGGTSAAAPGIAGCMAQLTQGYKEKFGEQPSGGLLKAALLNTANDLGNPGPDYKFGWGHVNAFRAWQLLEQENWLTDTIDQSEVKTHTLQIPGNTRQLKVMIYWAEPPAAESNARALLNDLDLILIGPAGDTLQPWLLDPTPNPTILDTPAGKGRDSLNNVEQVLIDNPAPGAYTIHINGYEVAMGPQQFYIVWETFGDELKLTYPTGGEGLVGGEKAVIHWDAYGTSANFTLRYSTDNGFSWLPIATVTGDKRSYEWSVPDSTTGQARVLIIRGSRRDTCDFPFSIVRVPQNLAIDKVCPDSIFLKFDEVNDTLSYDALMLGEKYMELVGTADTNYIGIPTTNPEAEKWVAVRASHPDGMAGRRTNAIQWQGGLKSCPQPDDVAVRGLVSPAPDAIITCGADSKEVTVRVVNEGQNIISGATLNYQLDNNPVVTETLPDIAPDDFINFTFQTPISFTQNGVANITVWSDYAGEDYAFNDTLSLSIPIVVQAADDYFLENLNDPAFPPLGWTLVNPDNATTWVQTPQNIVQADGTMGKSLFLNCYSYSARGQEDYIYLIPLDLTDLKDPSLIFNIAYIQYDGTYIESMRLEAFPGCDLSQEPIVLWEKEGPELATGSASNNVFIPDSEQDWRTEVIELDSVAGQSVILRLTSVNDFGNNIYLDDIGLIEYNNAAPVAAFSIAADTICRGDSTTFVSTTSGSFLSYEWNFGPLTVPSSAVGPGPHTVRFLSGGNKNIRMIATNPAGSDTIINSFYVRNFALSNFVFSMDDKTATFTNTSTESTSYEWDFGDGNTSTEENPVHVYADYGVYDVTLKSFGPCNTNERTKSVSILVSAQTPEQELGVAINPNPNNGNFRVDLKAQTGGTARLSLFDPSGRLVREAEVALVNGATSVPFEGLNLASGVYQLTVQHGDAVRQMPVVVKR